MLVAGLLAALAGCGGSGSDAAPLVVGVWGGNVERVLRETVAAPLEKEAGVPVALALGGTRDRVAKLYAERAYPTMDVAFLSMFEAVQAQHDGIVLAPDPALSPDSWPGMNQGCYAMAVMGLGIAYNKVALARTAPGKTPQWADLWDPHYRGRIALPPFPGAEAMGMLAIAGRMAGKDEHAPDAAFDKLAQLRPIPLIYNNLDELFSLLETGEIAMAPMISGYAYQVKDNYRGVDFAMPDKPGPVAIDDMLCLVANSPRPKMARRFAQMALGQRTQTAFANSLYFGPVNRRVRLTPQVSAKVIDTPAKIAAMVRPDWPYMMAHRNFWLDRWNEQILAN